MNYKIFSPSDELKGIVKQYVVFYSLEDIDKLLFLPNGGNFIIFNRGFNARTQLFGESILHDIPKNYSISFKTNKVKKIILDANCKYKDVILPIIAVELLPMGFYKLFDVKTSLMDLKYHEIEKWIVDKYFSKLYTKDTIEDELEYLNISLKGLSVYQNRPYYRVQEVIDTIYNDYNFDVTIDDLLKKCACSRSTLERQFKKMVGFTPKNFIYILKFCKTLLEYIDNKRTFHELQYIYSDNSHMNAVFQKFLGIAPSEIFKKVSNGDLAIYQLLNLKLDKEVDITVKNADELKKMMNLSKNFNVLYVEDNDMLRESMKCLLENYFDNIDVAKDGRDGLDKYVSNYNNSIRSYDLVITDISMPKMDGIEMSKEILRMKSSQIIMIISAHCEYMNSAEGLGVRTILLKPINNDELSNHIFEISKEVYLNKHK